MKLDTISLTTSTEYIRQADKHKFERNIKDKSNGHQMISHSLNTNAFGIGNASINETFNKVSLTLNSKLLGDNYHLGITLGTINQLVHNLSKEGLDLDPDFVNECKLKRIDVTDDIQITKPYSEYINSLNHLTAPKFTKTAYNTGIVFKEKLKHHKLYTTFYSKDFQPNNDKHFFKKYPEVMKHFDKTLRMETKLGKGGTISKHLNSVMLPEILSAESLNKQVLQKIISKQDSFPYLYETDEFSIAEEKDLIYTKYLNEVYNGDREAIKKHLKRKLGKNTKATYQLNKLDKYLYILNNSKDNSIKSNIQELTSSLQESDSGY